MNNTTEGGSPDLYTILNISYYCVLVPIGLCGNVLSAIVVSYIVRHQVARRSIPDVLLGLLALVDLFSVLGIHSVSIVAMAMGTGAPSEGLCIYQSFAVGVYFKLEFLLQVCISFDRYVALVRPLQYYRVSSMKKVRISVVGVALLSVSSTAVILGTDPSRSTALETWELCILFSDLTFIPHAAVVAVLGVLFALGFGAFVYCNVSLVRILWQYHAKRANSVLREINDAVQAMDSTAPPRSNRPSKSHGPSTPTPLSPSVDTKSPPKDNNHPTSNPLPNGTNNVNNGRLLPQTECVDDTNNHSALLNFNNNHAKNLNAATEGPKICPPAVVIEEPSSVVIRSSPQKLDDPHRLSIPCPVDSNPSKDGSSVHSNSSERPNDLPLASQHQETLPSLKLTMPDTTPNIHHDQFVMFRQLVSKLLRKVEKKAQRQRRELLLARLVIICASIFALSWIPFIVVSFMNWFNIKVHALIIDVSLKLIFANAFLNPIFYGLCRSNYRKGYVYVAQMACSVLTCGIVIEKPGEDRVFYESKKQTRKRHLEAADMYRRQDRMRKRRVSAQALQILQHTLQFRRAASPQHDVNKRSSFVPSDRLQELFERFNNLDSNTTDSSSVDYDALAFMDLTEGDLVQNLQRIWSSYTLGCNTEVPDGDIDLDVDYDAMVAADQAEVIDGIDLTFPVEPSAEDTTTSDPHVTVIPNPRSPSLPMTKQIQLGKEPPDFGSA